PQHDEMQHGTKEIGTTEEEQEKDKGEPSGAPTSEHVGTEGASTSLDVEVHIPKSRHFGK
ncbi:hypothetical protein KI387_011446, partial [Taxus chinensis]